MSDDQFREIRNLLVEIRAFVLAVIVLMLLNHWFS
jgi:hypothetical protein